MERNLQKYCQKFTKDKICFENFIIVKMIFLSRLILVVLASNA
jgi:hypothetical protein